MSNGTRVQPGEVISSSLINQILQRLDDLESATPDNGDDAIEMTGFDPSGGQEVGRILAILGSNLPFPADGNTVTIGSIPVPEANLRISSSTRQRLEFEIPPLGITGETVLRVRVVAGSSSAQLFYTFQPSSGGPLTPRIDAIRPNLALIGTEIAIEGANFSADVADNEITFTPLGVPDAATYPRPDGPGLNIVSTASDRIRVIVPDMEEVVAGAGAQRIEVQLTVTGNPDAASGEFRALRG